MYLNPEKDLSASHVVIGNTHPMWRRIFTFGKTSPSTKLKKLSRLQSLSEFSLLMLTQLCLQYWQAKKNISNMWSGLLVFNNWGTSPERNGYVRSIIISWIICGNISLCCCLEQTLGVWITILRSFESVLHLQNKTQIRYLSLYEFLWSYPRVLN